MVAIQFKLLGLIALCTLAASTVIERRDSLDHSEAVHKDEFEKRQNPPTVTGSLDSHELSNDAKNGSVASGTEFGKRQSAPTVTIPLGIPGPSNNTASGSDASRTSLVHHPRSTADTVMDAGTDGFDYHRYFANDNDEQHAADSLPNTMDATDKAPSSGIKRRQGVTYVPYVRVNETLKGGNSTTN